MRSIWFQTIIALLLGFLAGELWPDGLIYWSWMGRLFLDILKILGPPLIFISIFCGVTSLAGFERLGRLSAKTFGLYLITTIIAVTIGLLLGLILAPGGSAEQTLFDSAAPLAAPLFSISEILPVDIVAIASKLNPLWVIGLSLVAGVLCLYFKSASKQIVLAADKLARALFFVTHYVVRLAPLGVFALTSALANQFGIDILRPVLKLVGTVYLGCLTHLYIGLSCLLLAFKLRPIHFWQGILSAQLVAFSTMTAAGTLPITFECVRDNLGVSDKISRFTLPIGTVINMDGTAIYQCVVALFFAQLYGISLGVEEIITLASACVAASIGAASIPGGGLVLLSLVLNSIGLPLEGIGLIAGIDRILDMARTATNVSGDAAVTCAVAMSENELCQEVYREPPH